MYCLFRLIVEAEREVEEGMVVVEGRRVEVEVEVDILVRRAGSEIAGGDR